MATNFASCLLLLLAMATASTSAEETGSDNNVVSGLKLAYNTYQQCEEQADMVGCLKFRALRFVDRALRKESIPLMDGLVTLARTEEGARMLSQSTEEEDIEEHSLPQEPQAKQDKLDDMLSSRIERFFQTHRLQLNLPKILSSDNNEADGRGKGEKYVPIMMAMMMKGGLAAMAYKAVAVLAGKALLVAKVALVIAGMVALSKLGHGHGEEGRTTYEIIKAPSIGHDYMQRSGHVGDHGGHGWGRSLDSHEMAYGGQVGKGQVEEVPL